MRESLGIAAPRSDAAAGRNRIFADPLAIDREDEASVRCCALARLDGGNAPLGAYGLGPGEGPGGQCKDRR